MSNAKLTLQLLLVGFVTLGSASLLACDSIQNSPIPFVDGHNTPDTEA